MHRYAQTQTDAHAHSKLGYLEDEVSRQPESPQTMVGPARLILDPKFRLLVINLGFVVPAL